MNIQQYFEKEGILLDYDRIYKNPGLRSLAKLMLNSFWGKFGQRTNLAQTSYVTDTKEFFDFMTSDQQEIKNIRFVNEETVQSGQWKPPLGDFLGDMTDEVSGNKICYWWTKKLCI
ncbi:hypothetical protein MAR_037123 [Mya arenaria]|uniref:DNA-directed DNA polymerase n=1 Tax=Mya arenaria TaxID=6604 RepID=A0ABY7FQL8_MYAAR|nr:hypothetical protein MAR_037123 [Mya arenaria]